MDFHAATGLDTAAIAQVQAQVRQRILRAFVRRGLIDKRDRDEPKNYWPGTRTMAWEHGGGFSLDASVCIEGRDRAWLERLLRYCARPPFALEHLHRWMPSIWSTTTPNPAPTGAGIKVFHMARVIWCSLRLS